MAQEILNLSVLDSLHSWSLENFWLLPWFVLILALLITLSLKPLLWRLFSFDERIRSINSQKKSAEVKLGKLSETLAPILSSFPVDLKANGSSTVFLGQPIDYLHFEPDGSVVFIEIKSADAQLSSTQKRIKSAVEAGRVRWESVRIR